MNICDFGRSFLTFRIDLREKQPITLSQPSPTSLNNARIQIECVCDLTDRTTGVTRRYVLGASCKTERVGVERDIWNQPNADFCPIVSTDEAMLLKNWAGTGMNVKRYPESLGVQPERQVEAVADVWTSLKVHVAEVRGRVLSDIEDIIAAVFADRRLVGRLEYDAGNYHVRIDHPVKTINVNERNQVFQTDTGPVLLPDFSRLKAGTRLVAVFDLAYSAFNCPQWAEFIVNVPTPIGESVSVNHYSESRRIETMTNAIIEIEEGV